jgi:hypothetical protein
VPALPNPQLIAPTFKHWDVRGLIVSVIDAQVDIDDRLGRQARNRSTANMVDSPGDRPKRVKDPGSFPARNLSAQDGSYETIANALRSGPPINTTSSSIAGHRSTTRDHCLRHALRRPTPEPVPSHWEPQTNGRPAGLACTHRIGGLPTVGVLDPIA